MPPPLGPPYRIVTPRLVLRCWEPGDTPALATLVERNLEYLRQTQHWTAAKPHSLDELLTDVRRWRAEFDLDVAWRYAVCMADGGGLAGAAALLQHPMRTAIQPTAWFGEEFAPCGCATEAGAALARAALQLLDAPRVQWTCAAGDAETAAVCRQLGFTHDGVERRLAGGAHREDALWSLLPSEWSASPAAARAADAQAFDVLGNRLF